MSTNSNGFREVPPPPYNPYYEDSSPYQSDVKEHNTTEVSPYQLENQYPQFYPHDSHNFRYQLQPPPPATISTTTTRILPARSSHQIIDPPINTVKETTCLERYWSSVVDPNSWASCFYFLLISPLISGFAFLWISHTLLASIISMMFPPIGFFLSIVIVWSWRALGRLELLTVRICTFYKPRHSIKSQQFHQITTVTNTNTYGLLQYGGKLFFDEYTWSCFIYFIFIKSLLMIITWVMVLALFILAFSPLLLFAMPLMCKVCKNLGKWQVGLAKRFLLINSGM